MVNVWMDNVWDFLDWAQRLGAKIGHKDWAQSLAPLRGDFG